MFVLIFFPSYYDQLAAVQNKVPVNEVQIPFKWKDAFDKGSFFGGRISLTIPSFSYEKICILFNVAAYNSQAASEQNFESDEGLQKAMKKLQIVAGIFAHLKETAVLTIQRDPTPDLDPETLGILSGMLCTFCFQLWEILTIFWVGRGRLISKGRFGVFKSTKTTTIF